MLTSWTSDSALSLLAVLFATALVVAWLRTRRGSRGDRSRARPAALRKEWRELEPRIAQAFQSQGYQLIEIDRGVARVEGEFALRRDRVTYLVQCREWNSAKVGVEVVHALQRAMRTQGAAGGFVLTTGRFARDAVAYAAGCNVRLIDGSALHGLIEYPKGEIKPIR